MAVPWKRRKLEQKVSGDDEAMIRFGPEAFADHATLDRGVLSCFGLVAGNDEVQSMRRRGSMIQAIERDTRRLWADRSVANWLQKADTRIQRVSSETGGSFFRLC